MLNELRRLDFEAVVLAPHDYSSLRYSLYPALHPPQSIFLGAVHIVDWRSQTFDRGWG